MSFTGLHFAPGYSTAPEGIAQVQAAAPGLQELAEEGATQVFFPERNNDIILGAVGVLQFDVVASRLKEEYKVECLYEPINVWSARWVESSDRKKLEEFREKNASNLGLDAAGELVYLAPTRVNLQLAQERWPDIRFDATREQAHT